MSIEQQGARVAPRQPGIPGVEVPALVTARYAVVDPERMVPVRTSIGAPKWLGFDLVEWPAVYPWGLLDEPNRVDFRRRYRHRLHQRTSRILDELAELRATYDGWPLALCCFEDLRKPGQWCHRLILARWLDEHLGQEIPDLEVMPPE